MILRLVVIHPPHVRGREIVSADQNNENKPCLANTFNRNTIPSSLDFSIKSLISVYDRLPFRV
jgi:hypothetical protein